MRPGTGLQAGRRMRTVRKFRPPRSVRRASHRARGLGGRRRSAVAKQARADRLRIVPQRPRAAPSGAQNVGREREPRSGHPLEQDRRSVGADDTGDDLSDLEPRIDLRADADEIPPRFAMGKKGLQVAKRAPRRRLLGDPLPG